MTLGELREFLNQIPEEMDSYDVVNGEVGQIDIEDDDSLYYRVDKPIIALYVDDHSHEICFFHQTQEDVNNFYNRDKDDDTEAAE
jgi:hypothetical protein